MRDWAAGNRPLYSSLWMSLVLGLVAHVIAYLVPPLATGEPLALVVELLSAFGLALWTGVVVALFVQVIPEVKRRQLKKLLDALEALSAQHDAIVLVGASNDDGFPVVNAVVRVVRNSAGGAELVSQGA